MTHASIFRFSLLIAAAALAACSTTPVSVAPTIATGGLMASGADQSAAEQARYLRLYMRPPNRLFGLMLEQGSLDAIPDVAPMIEYQQQRMREREVVASLRKAIM